MSVNIVGIMKDICVCLCAGEDIINFSVNNLGNFI